MKVYDSSRWYLEIERGDNNIRKIEKVCTPGVFFNQRSWNNIVTGARVYTSAIVKRFIGCIYYIFIGVRRNFF